MKHLILRGILCLLEGILGGILGGFLFQKYTLWQENPKFSIKSVETKETQIYPAKWRKEGYLEIIK